jgi:GWxTD domain-containing protein
MKVLKTAIIVIVTLGLMALLPQDVEAKKKNKRRVKDLTANYRKWITEEVGYIITKWEKEVFLQLESDRERDMFIAAFWKNRDPNPYTEENEYKTEHYKRLNFANDRYGKGTPTPGWRTEMGRIYIILGEPHSVERYMHETETYPVIIWFYQGLIKYGLPNAFYVVFFKEDNSGDFELYSPNRHGPHKLLVNYTGDTHDVMSAFNQLYRVAPNLAKVSMTLIEGEFLPGARPTIQSDILLQKKIVEAPKKRVNDEYAKKLLKYKNYIDVDYSVNYITNAAKVKIFKDTVTGFYFLHYLVEPQKLSLEQFDDTLYGNLEINGSVFAENNEPVYQFSKDVPIRLKPNQIEKVKNKLFSYQDFFPLVPGKYRLEILIRNTTSKEFTSIERELVVPDVTPPGVGAVLLANHNRKTTQFKGNDKPFLINGNQMLASPKNDFTTEDSLLTFFQVHGLTDEQARNGYFIYTIFKDDGTEKPLKTVKKAITDYPGPDRLNFLEEFSLNGLPAAYYAIRISVYGKPDQFLFKGEGAFYITPISQLKRPWVISTTTPADGPEHLNTIAIQYANKKEFKKSLDFLEKAYNRSPSSPKLALNYCNVLFKTKQYRKIKTVATPFLNTGEKHKFLSFLGYASASLGEYMEAITHFKNHLAYYGTNIKILNAVGECYYKLGNADEALVAWERSLELFPDQEKLKALIQSAKKNKGKGVPNK